jgi:hypothetical protein
MMRCVIGHHLSGPVTWSAGWTAELPLRLDWAARLI